MQFFVLISILRGQPRTPPSGDNIGVVDYHLNASKSNKSPTIYLNLSLNHALLSRIKDVFLIISRRDKRCTLSKMVALCLCLVHRTLMESCGILWKTNVEEKHLFELTSSAGRDTRFP